MAFVTAGETFNLRKIFLRARLVILARLVWFAFDLSYRTNRSEESSTLPLLAIEYAMPGTHNCPCERCAERYSDITKREQDHLVKAELDVDQLWEAYNRQTHERIVHRSGELFAQGPRYQSNIRGYKREEVMEGFDACDPRVRYHFECQLTAHLHDIAR